MIRSYKKSVYHSVAKMVRRKTVAYQQVIHNQIKEELPEIDDCDTLAGYCAIASRSLCFALREEGIENCQLKYISSSSRGETHCWVEIINENILIDITADQFNKRNGDVLILKKDKHYKIHKMEGTIHVVNPFNDVEVYHSFKTWVKDQIPNHQAMEELLSIRLFDF